MLREYFKRELRSTIFWKDESDARQFIDELSKRGYKKGKDYKDIVKEEALGHVGYVVWTNIPEKPYKKIMNKLYTPSL